MQAALINETTEATSSNSLPKRDFVILPLISLATVLLLVGVTESLARLAWPEQIRDACEYYDSLGVRHRPFCSSMMKNVEGPWVRYRYNGCGYRGAGSCGAKTAGSARFVVIGTSIAFGLYVPEDQLFSVRAAPALSRILGKPVEFENLGMTGPDFALQYKLVPEIQRLQPDGVFFIVVPFDLKRLDDAPSSTGQGAFNRHPFVDLSALAYLGRSSRSFFMAQHFLLQDQEFAVRAFLMKGDPDDVAHVPETALAEKRWQRLGTLIDRLASDLRQRGIPLYVVALPSRLQAALIGRNAIGRDAGLPGVNPFAFPQHVAKLARAAGARHIDAMPQLQRTPKPERLFYPVDGHLNADGNRVLAEAVVDYFEGKKN